MAQIGNVPEIIAVKQQLDSLKKKGLIKDWELPYEKLLTRLTAAIFFLTPVDNSRIQEIWQILGTNKRVQYRENNEQNLSQLAWRLEFNKGFTL